MSSSLTGIGVVLAVAGGALYARYAVNEGLRKRAQERWQGQCEAAGLTLSDELNAYPRAGGTVEGVSVEAWVDELRTRGLTRQFVRVRLAVGGIPELYIRRRRPELDRSMWLEVPTGDGLFDAKIRVSAPKRQGIGTWLTPARRASLLVLEEAGLTWSVGDGVLGLSQDGLLPTDDAWQLLLRDLAQAARVLGPQ